MTQSQDENAKPVEEALELSDEEVAKVNGGLLLPAVQKVREAAARLNVVRPDPDSTNFLKQ